MHNIIYPIFLKLRELILLILFKTSTYNLIFFILVVPKNQKFAVKLNQDTVVDIKFGLSTKNDYRKWSMLSSDYLKKFEKNNFELNK